MPIVPWRSRCFAKQTTTGRSRIHARAVEAALDVPLDGLRRLDAERVEDRGDDVDRMVILVPDLALGLDAGRPRDDARVRRTAVELVALPHLERRVERHRPAVRVVVVCLRAAELVEHRHVRLDGVGDAVCELHLVDRAVRAALSGGPVVGDEDDDRVLAPAELLEEREQPPDLVVRVLEEPGVDLGHAAEQLLLVVGERVPRPRDVERREGLTVGTSARLRRPDRVDRRQLGVPRDDARAPSAGRASARAAPRSPCRSGPCTSRSTPSARGAARDRRRARSRGRTASPGATDFASMMNSIALSVRSSVRW